MPPPLTAPLGHVHHSNHLGGPALHQVASGLDSIMGPLKPGEITYVELPWKMMGSIVYQIAVEGLREVGNIAVQADGCNMANPYEIVKMANVPA